MDDVTRFNIREITVSLINGVIITVSQLMKEHELPRHFQLTLDSGYRIISFISVIGTDQVDLNVVVSLNNELKKINNVLTIINVFLRYRLRS